jgi:hypothetical protein
VRPCESGFPTLVAIFAVVVQRDVDGNPYESNLAKNTRRTDLGRGALDSQRSRHHAHNASALALVFSSFAVFPVATSRIILATPARSTALTRKLPIRGTT